MLDERYSLAAFQVAGLDTLAAEELASCLRDEILAELDTVIRDTFQGIICRLNDMGHNLKPYTPPAPGDLAYRDDSGEEGSENYTCLLRVGLDYIVSTGFAHLEYEEG